jgi:hypothetical protein
MATGTTFAWSDQMVCVATYNILEAESFMDQFEDSKTPFKKAGALKLGTLRYFPTLPISGLQMEALSIEVARTFLRHLAKNFTSQKENPALSSASIIRAVAGAFVDGKKTLTDLAKVVDDNFKFKDE